MEAVAKDARERAKTPRRFRRALAVASAIGAGVTVLTATAATASPTPRAAAPASATITSASRHKVFSIRSGKIFDVTASVHGVRSGDRLALESLYRIRPRGARHWHVLGSWRMHRGQRHFTGKTYGTTPGLFTLRVQFLRHRRLLKGSQSNQFQVRVRRFSLKRLAKPHKHKKAAATAVSTAAGRWPLGARPGAVINWQEPIQCAPDGGQADTVGHGILVPPPVANIGITGNVAQVIWVQAAAPGGTFGKWQIAATPVEETLTPVQPGTFSLGSGSDSKLSDELGATILDYPNDSGDVFRNVAWDLEIQASDGSWAWVSPTSWYTPSSYRQWSQDGLSQSASGFCETFNS
jgi:hypothetical protein